MELLILGCKALFLTLLTIGASRIKTLSTNDLNCRRIRSMEQRRGEATKLRLRREHLRRSRVMPSEYICEYIESLLGQRNCLAGTTTQIEHWIKPQRATTPKAYPSNPTAIQTSNADDWIRVKENTSKSDFKVAS